MGGDPRQPGIETMDAMTGEPGDDTIRFEEAGAFFEIFGPAVDGTRMMAIRDAAGELHGHEARSFEDACRYVDEWLDLHASDAPDRFRGLRFLYWDHEGGVVTESALATRGAFLEMFDEGTSPSDVDALRAWREGSGDLVLEIRDGTGRLLLDNREAARRWFDHWNREERRYDLNLLETRMSGTEEERASPVP